MTKDNKKHEDGEREGDAPRVVLRARELRVLEVSGKEKSAQKGKKLGILKVPPGGKREMQRGNHGSGEARD